MFNPMRIIVISCLIFVLPGCSAHEGWFGSTLPRIQLAHLPKTMTIYEKPIGEVIVRQASKVDDGKGNKTDDEKEAIVIPSSYSKITKQEDIRAVFAWSPEYNAAAFTEYGACIQRADVQRTEDVKASLALIDKLRGDLPQSGGTEDSLASYDEDITLLKNMSDVVGFVDAIYYGHCMLIIISGIKEQEVVAVTNSVIEGAFKVLAQRAGDSVLISSSENGEDDQGAKPPKQ